MKGDCLHNFKKSHLEKQVFRGRSPFSELGKTLYFVARNSASACSRFNSGSPSYTKYRFCIKKSACGARVFSFRKWGRGGAQRHGAQKGARGGTRAARACRTRAGATEESAARRAAKAQPSAPKKCFSVLGVVSRCPYSLASSGSNAAQNKAQSALCPNDTK